MKAKCCFSTDVVESDSFLSLSLEAQLAYYHINSLARPSGKVIGLHRILRSYGFDDDVLLELTENGYLLDVDGSYFIAHHWLSNNFEQRLFDSAMARCEEYQAGRIVFAGEPGKSKFVLPK